MTSGVLAGGARRAMAPPATKIFAKFYLRGGAKMGKYEIKKVQFRYFSHYLFDMK